MKIIFIGNFDVVYSSESQYKKTLEDLGHEVITAQENHATYESLVTMLDGVDMLLHVHTHGDTWKINGIEKIYAICKDKGIPTVGYHLDLFKGIGREPQKTADPYWNIEYFFTCDGNFVQDLRDMGIKSFYLPAGVYDKECYMATPDREKYPHDVIFVGSKGYHHEWQYRPKLIDWLKNTYGEKFGHYGGDGLGVVRGHELNQLYASAKVVVGDTLCINYDYPYYFSDRLFETTGRGGFLIFPYIKGLEDNFEIGKELISYPFNDFKYLQSVIDFYLSHDVEREAIRLAGHKRAKENHTYTQRLSYIIDEINKNKQQI